MTSDPQLISVQLMFHYFHIGAILSFSFCLIIIQIRTRAVTIWILSNFITIIGSLYTLIHIESGGQSTNAIAAATILLSSHLKALSFADRDIFRKGNKISTILFFIGIIVSGIIFIVGETDLLLFLVSISGVTQGISAILYLLNNKNWIGLTALKYCFSVLSVSVGGLIFLLVNAYPIGARTRFIPPDSSIPYNLIVLAVLIFLFHMSFIGLIMGRRERESMMQLRKSIRIREVITHTQQKEKESAVLADERYHLLRMLTHEVRQPMNTAQAALEALIRKISSGAGTPEYLAKTLQSASSTLNSVVLSISNSILGAALIAKGRLAHLTITDLCSVCELALLDLDAIAVTRVHKRFEQAVVFAEADPIILRLAIRNLLENAVKYSPEDSKIFLDIVLDEEKFLAVMRVTNQLTAPLMKDSDIFRRDSRGVDKKYQGLGLGLYITKEVATMHKGTLAYHINNDNTVTFELAVPA